MSVVPLTVGTAGHVDHGKTALVAALTGVDTDRLPQERQRGMSIELGFAPLRVDECRWVSLVDVPGHERFVRTMVAGATGIDAFLMVVAADDGVMPQTVEHAAVLAALGVTDGVVAVTKCDRADPSASARAAGELFPRGPIVPCSARTGHGIEAVRHALAELCASVGDRDAAGDGETVLHVDRSFSIRGAGTVVTGTLWTGRISRGDQLLVLPGEHRTRARSVQVHDRDVASATAGQRVAVNLPGLELAAVPRGCAVIRDGERRVVVSRAFDAAVDADALLDRTRVQVHHGTRQSPARVRDLGRGRWRLRTEQPLILAVGDRFVLRSIAPPNTLGGGAVVDVRVATSSAAKASRPVRTRGDRSEITSPSLALSAGAIVLEEALRSAGARLLALPELANHRDHLPVLLASGRAVRVGRAMYTHPDVILDVKAVVESIVDAEGSLTLARLRDELGTSRRCAEALIERLDTERFTRRLPDDRRVLRSGRRTMAGERESA